MERLDQAYAQKTHVKIDRIGEKLREKKTNFKPFKIAFVPYLYVGMFDDILWYGTNIKYIFQVKIQLFVKAKSLTRFRIRIGLAPWIRIRPEIKCWIRIRIETYADPQHSVEEIF